MDSYTIAPTMSDADWFAFKSLPMAFLMTKMKLSGKFSDYHWTRHGDTFTAHQKENE